MTAFGGDWLSIETECGEVRIRREALPMLSEVDGIIFDVDGVLIDVSESIQLVHGETARRIFEGLGWTNCEGMVTPADVDAFKHAGGFNNDWDVAAAWMLLYLLKSRQTVCRDGVQLSALAPSLSEFADSLAEVGGKLSSAVDAVQAMCEPGDWEAIENLWDRAALVGMFQEVYTGDMCPEVYGFQPKSVQGPGLNHRDRPILDKRNLPPLKLGIATGRTGGETRAAVKLLDWQDVFAAENLITEDDGFLKPDPRILDLAVRRLGARFAVYIGDTPDDMLTVKRYRAQFGPMLACMALTGLKDASCDDADMIADDVNAALLAIEKCRGGSTCREQQK